MANWDNLNVLTESDFKVVKEDDETYLFDEKSWEMIEMTNANGWANEGKRHKLANKSVRTYGGSNDKDKSLKQQIFEDSIIPENTWRKFSDKFTDEGQIKYAFEVEIKGKSIPVLVVNIYTKETGSDYLTTSVDKMVDDIPEDLLEQIRAVEDTVHSDFSELSETLKKVIKDVHSEYKENEEKYKEHIKKSFSS